MIDDTNTYPSMAQSHDYTRDSTTPCECREEEDTKHALRSEIYGGLRLGSLVALHLSTYIHDRTYPSLCGSARLSYFALATAARQCCWALARCHKGIRPSDAEEQSDTRFAPPPDESRSSLRVPLVKASTALLSFMSAETPCLLG